MLEDRNLFYLSRAQRLAVSVSITVIALVCGFAIYVSVVEPKYKSLLQPSVELLKLVLTGAAAWWLVVMYASANSPERIERETKKFFANDLPRAFQRQGFGSRALERGRALRLVINDGGNAVLQANNNGKESIFLWCQLNVSRLTIVFLLDPRFSEDYQLVFQASLKGFASQGLSVESFGLQTHDADGALGAPRTFFEMFVARQLPQDFLFNAASRYATASSLAGDARSLLIETRRASAQRNT